MSLEPHILYSIAKPIAGIPSGAFWRVPKTMTQHVVKMTANRMKPFLPTMQGMIAEVVLHGKEAHWLVEDTAAP